MSEKEDKVFSTTNLSQAAWLLMHDKDLKCGRRTYRQGQKGQEFYYEFYDPDDDCAYLVLNFISSEARRFDDAVRSLRAVANSSSRN